jgi:predicted anti-sigma-YlaC factor YlaD
MRCERCQEAVSARLDGEDPGVEPELVAAHLARCARCAAFARAAGALPVPTAVDPAPDLGASVLLAIGAEARSASSRRAERLDVRWALGALALLQVVVAIPDLLVAGQGATVHATREVGSFDIALAVGLAVVAWRPHRAAALFPMLVALTACLVVTGWVDVARGDGALGSELVAHLGEVVGTVFVWLLARDRPGHVAPVS